ncbi:hypothetical protein J3R82DRAFT_7467 [Butyriboletus roseoflavus]|nr:hypothetical protein J3R82DRAFT_7467 [Butyriboletus roseoflavus]
MRSCSSGRCRGCSVLPELVVPSQAQAVAALSTNPVGPPPPPSPSSNHNSPNHSSAPLPTASGCYPPSNPSGNCTDVITNWYDGNWRASRPGSMEMANYETYELQNGTIDACFLNTSVTGTCGQGRVPVIGVDARLAGDIQAAVGFAVEHGLKLVVKNTG